MIDAPTRAHGPTADGFTYRGCLNREPPETTKPKVRPKMTTATKTPKITARAIAECLRAAREAAEAIDNTDDGGTCNLDSPAFRLPRVSDKLIQEAAELAGVSCAGFQWWGRNRWYWVHGSFLRGHGNWRARTSRAATQALRDAAALHCPQMEVCEYCQMD